MQFSFSFFSIQDLHSYVATSQTKVLIRCSLVAVHNNLYLDIFVNLIIIAVSMANTVFTLVLQSASLLLCFPNTQTSVPVFCFPFWSASYCHILSVFVTFCVCSIDYHAVFFCSSLNTVHQFLSFLWWHGKYNDIISVPEVTDRFPAGNQVTTWLDPFFHPEPGRCNVGNPDSSMLFLGEAHV